MFVDIHISWETGPTLPGSVLLDEPNPNIESVYLQRSLDLNCGGNHGLGVTVTVLYGN